MRFFSQKHPGKRRKASTPAFLAFFMICSATVLQAQNQSYTDLKEKVTAPSKVMDAASLFQLLQQQTGYTFVYDDTAMKSLQIAPGSYKNSALGVALKQLNQVYGLQFIVAGKNISVRKGAPAKPAAFAAVTGRIIDEENGDPVVNATIHIGNKGVASDIDGSFRIILPRGKYAAEISAVGYGSKRITDIDIKDHQTFELTVALKRQKGQLQQVTVTASARKESVNALYVRQKNNAAISDGISAEQIRATPDNNAAQVLKRVSGLTIQDEKFVTVRGLSDRYNTVLLNGAALPSTEPNRRNFSFDIIPSGLIDNIVVNKTATPDMPAEFAGGVVQVNTKDIPHENYTIIGAGTGINTNSTGKKMHSTKRGKQDYWGYDDGNRQWWQRSWNRFNYSTHFREGNYKAMGEMNQSVPNNWGLYGYRYSPVQAYQLAAGRKINLKNGAAIGVTFAASYRHDETNEDEERKTYGGSQYNYKGNAYLFRSSLGGVLNIAYQHQGHRIAFKNLYNHLFTNETTVYTGTMVGFGPGEQLNKNYTSITLLNSIWHHRLEGEHVVGKKGIKLEWSGDLIKLKRDQPDTRYSFAFRLPPHPENYYDYYVTEGTGFLGVGSSLFNAVLKEDRYNWTTNLTIPFSIGTSRQKIKAGYAGTYREAFFESIGLLIARDHASASNPAYFSNTKGLPDYELFSPQFFKPGYLFYHPAGSSNSVAGDDYTAMQQLHTGFLMADLNFLKKFRFAGGLRAEQNKVTVNTITYNRDTGYPVDSMVVFNKLDLFPSANLIYALSSKTNIRLTYGQTISRPDFRERSPFNYYEFKQRAEYKGAKGLKDARITNLDFRVEYYPAPGEVISLSAFYKKFDSPVELVIAGQPQGEVYYYFNLRNSTAFGTEIDARKSLSFIDPSSSLLKNIIISGNATWMSATVRYNTEEMLKAANDISGGTTATLPPDSRKRSLQGLSPYVYNAAIGYFGKPVAVNLSYNRSGPRIVAGGLYPYDDQYENARDVLDLQLSTRLLHNKMDLRFNISDLLQQAVIIYQNMPANGVVLNPSDIRENINDDPRGNKYNPDLDYTRFRGFRGRNLSINITYTF